MDAGGERRRSWLHAALALAALVLLATSPWLALRSALGADATLVERGHAVIGVLLLPLGLTYAHACLHGGGWRELLPVAPGRPAAAVADLAALLHGRVPTAEGGGLFGLLKGLVLLALLAAAGTGLGWLLVQGGAEALAWRHWHLYAARTFAALLAAHVLAVALHVLALARG